MIKFRPLFWLTIVAVPVLVSLVALGTWQLQRLQWKNDIISSFEARSEASPMRPPAAISSESEFQRLAIVGEFLHDKEIYLTGRTYEGNAGFHVVTPLVMADRRVILVNRGWVSESYRDRATRKFSLVDGEVVVDAILRLPNEKGYFVPKNDPVAGFWFTLVPAEVAQYLGFQDSIITSYYADALRAKDVLTLPIGAKTELNLRNAHLSYALTWYGIALSLIGVYAAFHHQAGRLRFGAAARE